MPLNPGTRLGSYEVLSSLGAGGMGEVYRATDTKLKRQVAIKILPPSLAADHDRLTRFQREAEVLASLNHPNIAGIHGIEESEGSLALVMELVEGEDLSAIIARGPIPFDDALPIAKQIADALDAAHERGIVHRDLKPANVKVRPDGTVKVLDFGLAKAMAPASATSPSISISPTYTSPAMTEMGMILGTAAYMSPEQARGRPVDKRSDIWAFGVVLFEMLTGQRVFQGEDVSLTLSKILQREPDFDALPADTPANVHRLLRRCLQKDPKRRLHDIADARIELEEPTAPAPSIPVPAMAAPNRASRPRLAAAVIAILGLAIVAGVQTWRVARHAGSTQSPVRFAISSPRGFDLGGRPAVATSPDGTAVVLAYERGPFRQLFLRRFGEDAPTPIAGTEGASSPFFSPDGQRIAFRDSNALQWVSINGGAPLDVTRAEFGSGAWTPDDTIVFTPNYSSGLWRVPVTGGQPQELTKPNTADGELGHFWPQMLPDGKTVLFTAFRVPANTSRLEVYSLEDGARKVVQEGGFFGRYAATGHLLFARSTTVLAVPFSLQRLETSGQPQPVVTDVSVAPSEGFAQFDVSPAGALAYVRQTDVDAPKRLAWVDRTGRASHIGDIRRRFRSVRLSPDGTRVALTIDGDDADLWMYDLGRDSLEQILTSPGAQTDPVWTPDGRRLFFVVEEPVFHIYTQSVGGVQKPERIVDGAFDVIPLDVSPDGRFLVYQRNDPGTRWGIWLLPLTGGDATPRVFVDTPAREGSGVVSPDGRWLAYLSDATGRPEVYLQSFPDGAERFPVSVNGGISPVWSANGEELFFRETDKMMVASVRGRVVGRPAVLFEKRFTVYDVAHDGRFLVGLPDEDVPPAPVHVVLNWHEELKRIAPLGK